MARIGTGNYVTQYSRPSQNVVTEEYAKRNIEKGYYKEIAPNMFSHTFKLGHAANTYILTKKGKEWLQIAIPTSTNGQIRDVVMAERILDVEDGDRQGHTRNVLIDIGIDADSRCSPEELAESYKWYLYPNESDVKGIDDSKTKIVTILGADKSKGKPPARMIITGGTEVQRQQLADAIRLNFTGRERDILRHCLVQIVPSARGFAGCFQGHADMAGKPLGVPKIIIVSEHAKDSDVIIHEAIHALREFDPKRDYRFRAVKQYLGRDADLEESMTEAETVTRQNPFTKHESTAGYYHFIKVPDPGKSKKDLIVEDRVTVTGKEKFLTGGVKGKRVQKTLSLKYPSMYISKLRIKGGAEAIDTYWQTNNRRGDPTPPPGEKTTLHFYDPHGTNEKTIATELKQEGKTVQWEDGKAVNRGGTVTIREVPETERKEHKPQFRINRKSSGSGRGVDLGADIVRDRRGRHLRL